MEVEEHKAAIISDVLRDEILQQRRFAASGFAQYRDVFRAPILGNREWNFDRLAVVDLRPNVRVLPGRVNGSVQARWLKTIEVFNEQGERLALAIVRATPP